MAAISAASFFKNPAHASFLKSCLLLKGKYSGQKYQLMLYCPSTNIFYTIRSLDDLKSGALEENYAGALEENYGTEIRNDELTKKCINIMKGKIK
jgi:hypothetical protein